MKVMIAACDTFRAGAVEQLRTHTRKLNTIHDGKQMVQLFDKGYDKDAAAVALSAITHGMLHFALSQYACSMIIPLR